MKVSVSFLKTPIGKEETIKKINESIADYIHVDFMDGKLFGEKNFEKEEIIKLLEPNKKPLDIHLMTEEIEEYINLFANLQPEFITFHIEANCDTLEMIKKIKQNHIKAGLAINPNTDLNKILPFLSEVDLVLVMSVMPGKGGQAFLSGTKDRLKELKQLQAKNSFLINVDGGINNLTISEIKIDTDIIVSGSFICYSKHYNDAIQTLKK